MPGQDFPGSSPPRGLWADSEEWEGAPAQPLADPAALETLARSGLVEAEWYLQAHADVAAHGIAALPHFLDYGWREGRRRSLLLP